MEIIDFLEYKENDTPNITLVKNLYKALIAGDRVTVGSILSDSPTWNVCPGCPEGGVYPGLKEIFGVFYKNVMEILIDLRAEPEVFVDGGNMVVALGFYSFRAKKDGQAERARFSHTWKITSDNRVDGVWQVCDSHQMHEFLKANDCGE